MISLAIVQLAAAAGAAQVGSARFEVYGEARVDAVYDDSPMDDAREPFRVLGEQEDRNAPLRDGEFALHPRASRVGLRLSSDKASGVVEVDFLNGGGEARQLPRVLHAYAELRRPCPWMSGAEWQLLAGQTWDVIAPLRPAVTDPNFRWNAGNLGDRRPQVRVAHTGAHHDVAVAAYQSGTIDARDLDRDGVPDGQDSGMPGWQLRVGGKVWKLAGGLWGHLAWSEADERSIRTTGRTSFTAFSQGLDLAVQAHDRVAVRLEAFTGRDLADVRGGIDQGVNSAGGYVRARGGWIDVPVRVLDRWTIAPVVTLDQVIKESDVADAPDNPKLNMTATLSNRFDLGGGLALAADLTRWITTYVGGTDAAGNAVPDAGAADRVVVSLSFTP